ncbi:cupin domain-containing protein [Paenibacillus soyae]|uniref:Cupin domain-containing protein n=1 Tax=Paenibacillus soyae TaxID=2969249 RepID=A0A9X2S9Y3_9BACL|nr:cupin domain-containing protein [Paenibacillus soyae]MCR2805550.1 cupin domain-containing protein [Paenibacillus soyae]
MHKLDLLGLIVDMHEFDSSYKEFLKVPAMSAGIYKLPAGSSDQQQPHSEDELYYVLRGHGRFHMAGEDCEAVEGTILFVPAHVEHRFHSITEELLILVVFAPAEYSNRKE